MSVETLIADCEDALVRLVRLALLARYPTQNDLAGLTSLQAEVLHDGSLCYVANVGLFEWKSFSTATPDGTNVLVPSTLPPGKTNGRWVLVVTTWTYGAGGTNLGSKASGYLRTVEAYSSDDDSEQLIERIYGRTPSVVVKFVGDSPESISDLPGTFYRSDLSFKLLIVTSNLRGGAAATQGSPVPSEDLGAYRIVGDLRRVMCGVSPDSGIAGVERIEIGDSALEFEVEDRRLFVWSMDVTVKASFDIQDEDLVAAAIEAQPALTDCYPARRFDRQNYVARGGGLDEGAGATLDRTIGETLAVVGGVALSILAQPQSFAADSDTYRDLRTDGVWIFSVVEAGAQAPTQPDGTLRVAFTRTSGAEIVFDHALCSYSIPFSDPIPNPRA